MDLGLAGRVALVLGASSGMGRGIAGALAAEGARVAVASRSRERIDEAAASIGATGFVHDVADLDAAPRLVERVVEELGPVDVLVTNTGGPRPGADPLGFARPEWEEAYRALVLGPMAVIEAVVPAMRARGFGRILNVASAGVREPHPALVLSTTHRAATLAAFKTLARHVAADGVTVNTLLPGIIATPRAVELSGSRAAAEAQAQQVVPAGRLGTVEEVAAAAAFLCSARAGYVTGAALLVDGGVTRAI